MKHGLFPRLMALCTIVLLVIAVNCKKTTTEDKKIFIDDFNRANGHPGSNYWLYLPNTASFNISSLQLYPNYISASPAAFYVNKITDRHYISAKMSISGGTYTGVGYLVGRSSSTDSYNNAYVCGYNGGSLILGKMVSGTLTIFGAVGLHTLTTGVADTITFTMDGTSLKCGLTGGSTVSVSVADSTYFDGYDGLVGGGASVNFLYFDDLSIQKL